MCTAIRFLNGNCYFGRTLDVERSYGEQVVVTPKNFCFDFRKEGRLCSKYAVIGMGAVVGDYPLYFEAANEAGLAMAGLNFPKSACYFPQKEGACNIAPFEFIPWVLAQCENLRDAKRLLENLNLCAINFSDDLPLSPLHWIIADKDGAITVESVSGGLKIYENKVGVLTNEPPFDYHMTHLCDYMGLSKDEPENRFGASMLESYSRGMGAVGLPGDFSSASRFVRAAFVKQNSVCGDGEEESVTQFFHILGAVEQVCGCVRLDDGSLEFTAYSSCIDLNNGVYYYTTYGNSRVSAIDMRKCNLGGDSLEIFPLAKEMVIHRQN